MKYGWLGALLFLAACKGHAAVQEADAETTSTTTTTNVEGDAGPVTVEKIEAGSPGEELKIGALDPTTPVFSAPEWPAKDPSKTSEERAGVQRLGYIRKGAVVAVKPNIVKKQSCLEGWYELVTGGFVCGKYATTDMSNKELANAPHAPFTDRPLPYEYGMNITNGAPLYRRRPLKKERNDLEHGLAVGKARRHKEGEPEPVSAGETDPNSPWYLKDHHGQRPQVTIDELRSGEQGGLVILRMVKGFYLALDRDVSTSSGRFWKNTSGFWAPADHILVHKSKTEFEGVHLGAQGEARKLPLGWVVGPHVHKYYIEGDGDGPKHLKRGDGIDRFTIVQLTGEKLVFEDRVYFKAEDGSYLRDIDAAVTRPGAVPKGLLPNEKWIDVNLTTQSLVAFEGENPVYATIVSTGRHNDTDKAKDHRTVKGEFRIREKHIAATMEDDGASDGPYSIQDVPWIMYFEGSYALHGAFWHSMFGRERSHGCVNLTPHDAKEIFGWSAPTLPAGWHGVRATKENPGTRVIVHE